MSQWGAYGQAKAGRDYQQILATYYRGTTMGSAPETLLQRVRVLVADGLATATVANVTAVFDAAGKRYPIPSGTIATRPDLKLPVGKDGKPVALTGPVTIRAAKGAFLAYGGKQFRGDLRLAKVSGRIQLVNVVGLEDYLLGVVPGEMPKDWPLAALEAQAVAARTYAVGNIVKGKPFDLYSDWRSQVYYGVQSEAPGPTQAVEETAGRILTYDGAPAQTFYFSSSGGRTISALDAFGLDLPYLASVDDPWDVDSPNHSWTPRLLTGAQLAARFGLKNPVADATYVPGAPGKPAVVRFTTADGQSAEQRLSDVRTRLGLKSTGFRLGLLRFDEPVTAKAETPVVRLTGVARNVDDAMLERRTPAGTWVTVKRLAPSTDGIFAVKLRPTGTTVYRLSADGLVGPRLTVRVTGVRRRALLWALAVAAALVLPATGRAGHTTVGLRPDANPASVSAAIARATGERPTTLVPHRALSVNARPGELHGIAGVAWVEPDRVRRVSFVPDRPPRAEAVVCGRQPRVRRVDDAAAARSCPGRRDRLRDRPRPSRPLAADRPCEELRRRHAPGHPRARHDRGRDHRRAARQRRRASRGSHRPRSSWSRRWSERTGRSRCRPRRALSTGRWTTAPAS